ncbi:N-acetylmuramoyl-L-alanine amidase [Butyrivibrio fibrisolvens DSM 3071]|uniref:N-acetylmuramoyl-L-alanine amidase n=2 Tax=Butyrivibrio fibrisolvens TaxID=831 RepID=A0A1M6B9X4_BUTFI|nr:N-acetylmuramoyl-L-alanine amidase [Butyrivibrio fibrisolvens DSM 3071]
MDVSGKRSRVVSLILSVILSVFLLVPNISYRVSAKDVMTLNAGSATECEVRAVWFSFRDWQKYLQGKDKAAFTSAFETITDNILGAGCNTLIMHVRSHNDAVYPSAIYPWSSEMLMGVDPGFDPLSIMIDIAHKKGLSIHAWINPYGFRNGEYCGDASLATHDNIIAGIEEILKNYKVDGIHFDDYFPVMDASIHNKLVSDVYKTCHKYGKVFGISPTGNVDNNIAKGADIVTWMSVPGYIDYIAPQIYWTNMYKSDGSVTLFSNRLLQWITLNKLGLPMYVGLALYMAEAKPASDLGWSVSNANIMMQVTELRANNQPGFILYSYNSLLSPACSAELANLKGLYNSAPSYKVAMTEDEATNTYTIAIDPGHQAHGNSEKEPIGPGASTMKAKVAGGTKGVSTNIPEYELTLNIALLLRDDLLSKGYNVVMIRETNDVDISNAQRAQIANDAGADIFIRLHADAVENGSVTGATALCQTSSNPYNGALYTQSRLLSECILSSYTQVTGIKSRGISETDTMTGINWSQVPVTIIEMGFMTNAAEDQKMNDPEFQLLMVQGLSSGIDMYFASK